MVWGFGLNGLWEFLQSPLYADWQREWSYLLWTRLHCTTGDVLILMFSFWGTSLLFGTRRWMADRRVMPVVTFLAFGLGYTVWSEWFNTSIRSAWSYAPAMPLIFGIGVAPLMQWIVVPSVLVWLVRRSPRCAV